MIGTTDRDEVSERPECGQVLTEERVYWTESLVQAPDERSRRRMPSHRCDGLRLRRIVAGTGVFASPVMIVVRDPPVNRRAL